MRKPMQCAEGHLSTGPMYLHSKCHTDSPTWAKLTSSRDELIIECAECQKEIARFKLAV